MPGVPGRGGPVPKRSDQRRRTNKPVIEVSSAAGASSVPVPPAAEHWHALVRDWYESLARSGQAAFYEPSDWQVARYVAEAMHRNVATSDRFSATLFASVMSAMSNLLVTEGDRRRLRIELERAAQVDADVEAAVTALDEYLTRISG